MQDFVNVLRMIQDIKHQNIVAAVFDIQWRFFTYFMGFLAKNSCICQLIIILYIVVKNRFIVS